MPEPTVCGRVRGCADDPYCGNCDRLVGIDGLHVVEVGRDADIGRLRVVLESPPGPMGCPRCGVVAVVRGRRDHTLVDVPAFGSPVRLLWRKRTWRCLDPDCPTGTFTEQAEQVAAPRALLTKRACWWAIGQLRREHASVLGLARQLGTSWRTLWRAVRPLLETMAGDETRFDGVAALGVDEHIWHHVSIAERGPKELTGMVDLTRDQHGRVRARLLDLVPGRSGTVYAGWLEKRGEAFRDGVQVATLDPFHGYKNALDDQLADATAVLDAFHVVKLGTQAVDEVRRRVQQDTLGHRGHKDDPLYKIRGLLRHGAEHLTDRERSRLQVGLHAGDPTGEVTLAWQCYQRLRASITHPARPPDVSWPNRSSPRSRPARSPRWPALAALRAWRQQLLAYFATF